MKRVNDCGRVSCVHARAEPDTYTREEVSLRGAHRERRALGGFDLHHQIDSGRREARIWDLNNRKQSEEAGEGVRRLI